MKIVSARVLFTGKRREEQKKMKCTEWIEWGREKQINKQTNTINCIWLYDYVMCYVCRCARVLSHCVDAMFSRFPCTFLSCSLPENNDQSVRYLFSFFFFFFSCIHPPTEGRHVSINLYFAMDSIAFELLNQIDHMTQFKKEIEREKKTYTDTHTYNKVQN